MKYLEGIAEFCAVADVGNFTGAANKLDTSVAQISRKVASLEKQLGVKLLQRTTRSVSLTEAGTQYFQQAMPALKALEDAQLAVSALQASPQGLIKLTAPVAFGEAFIAPLLNTFMQKYAGISVQCTFSNEKLDIVELGLDLAIRIGKLEDSTLVAKKLATRHLFVCGSRDYFKEQGQPKSIEELKELPVGLTGGSTIPLSEVANISFKEQYSSFSREETKRRIAVLVNPRGRDTESFIQEAQSAVEEKVKLPPGYYMEWGGNFKNLNQAKERLSILAPIALLFVLIMIYAAFRNVYETILIFLCVPFALVGGVLALMFKGIPFSVSAGVGFIALSGIAVLNGVVLVNNFKNLRDKGKSGLEVIKSGALLRLRPVMMTALTDILGFLPMAIATGLGAEVQTPLATVIIGGIISSTILTLILLPVLYSSMEKWILVKKS